MANNQHIRVRTKPNVTKFGGRDELVDLADAAEEVLGDSPAARPRLVRQRGRRGSRAN